ncbi:MAG: RsmB/NOP family class I SAM-dependent RNA methyltransferase [Saprospiraceae bacterium]|nr:RsmB/NOP family class I SAM-dependent RNA methyltransferase [Saprospiraceae bacterium]
MTKIHRNLVVAVGAIVRAVMQEGAYADREIGRILKANAQWGSRDRAFVAESSYDIIRNYRLVRHLAGDSKDPSNLLAALYAIRGQAIPVQEFFAQCDEVQMQIRLKEAASHFALLHSYPDEWVEWFRSDYPETYQQELIALNKQAPLVLRVNTLKMDKKRLLEALTQSGRHLECTELSPDALVAQQKWNVFQDPLFRTGAFEVQDVSSQRVAGFAQVQPGQRVIDACAGAGGKSLHLAASMRNKGRIIALDTEEWKLEELRKRARRAGVGCVETRWIRNNKIIKRLEKSCDRLLLDVPCSGTGVLKRNPDAKWKVDEKYVQRVCEVQQGILETYHKMLRPGGKLIYVTCSMLRRENVDQIAYFCARHPHFHLEEELSISPAATGFDGFYMARLVWK